VINAIKRTVQQELAETVPSRRGDGAQPRVLTLGNALVNDVP
jgi:hypothetical protein